MFNTDCILRGRICQKFVIFSSIGEYRIYHRNSKISHKHLKFIIPFFIKEFQFKSFPMVSIFKVYLQFS